MTHGTPTGYAVHGCRCPDCTSAQRVRMREYRKRRTNAVPTDGNATTPGTTEIGPRDAQTSEGRGPEPHGGPEHG